MKKIWSVYFTIYDDDYKNVEDRQSPTKVFTTYKRAIIFIVNTLVYKVLSKYDEHCKEGDEDIDDYYYKDIDTVKEWFEKKFYKVEYTKEFADKLISHPYFTNTNFINCLYDYTLTHSIVNEEIPLENLEI